MKLLKIVGLITSFLVVVGIGAYFSWYWNYNCYRWGEGSERSIMGDQYCDDLIEARNNK